MGNWCHNVVLLHLLLWFVHFLTWHHFWVICFLFLRHVFLIFKEIMVYQHGEMSRGVDEQSVKIVVYYLCFSCTVLK